jgi:hypothetical protein
MTEASYYNISKTGVLEQVTSLENALEFVKIGGYIWLDYYQPTREQLSQFFPSKTASTTARSPRSTTTPAIPSI